MANERDDRWRGGRDDRYGYEDRDEFMPRGERERPRERGFFERAGDEIASFFGNEESGQRSRRDEERGYGRERERGWFSGSRDEDRRDRERGFGARDQERDEDRGARPMQWTTSNRDYRQGYDREMEGRRDYRPMAGDYGRGSGDERRERGRQRPDEDRRDPDRGSEWQRDPYRSTSFAGSAVRSNRQDAPYDEWRRRHMSDLDRDYDEYRREHQQRFESDFGSWRERRQSKRQLLGQVREHMDVVGSDGEHVGTVDKIAGDKVILTKTDPDAGGHHHSISCTAIDRIEDDRVILDMDAKRAKDRWRDEDRDRALFEREDQGEAGPGFLNRSFSGTYR